MGFPMEEGMICLGRGDVVGTGRMSLDFEVYGPLGQGEERMLNFLFALLLNQRLHI